MSGAIAETSHQWQLVSLEKVIRHRKGFIQIDDLESYKRCRVQVDTKGIILRDIVRGTEIRTKAQQVCRSEELLVAEIDAKMGGYGIVPESLDGAIVSSHYFLYEIDRTQLDLKFLDFFIRTPGFRDQVAAQGSTNYAAIRPHHVLEYQIPLPPLDEQRRVVARIEELVAKVDEARGLRSEAIEEVSALFSSKLNALFAEAKTDGTRFAEIGEFTIYDRYGPRFYNEPYSQNGIPIMRATDINNEGRIDYRFMPKIALSPEASKELVLKPGDLIVIRSGSIGLSAVFDRDDIDCIASAYAIQSHQG